MTIEVTVVPDPTTAVAAAATFSDLSIITISFWKSVLTLFSFLALKNGLTLSTLTIVEPIPTDLMRYVVGKILALYSSLFLLISLPPTTLSSVCLHHLTGLFILVLALKPRPS